MKTSLTVLLVLGLMHGLKAAPPGFARPDLDPLFVEAPPALTSQARPAEAHIRRSRVVQLNARILAPGRGSLQHPGTRLAAHLFGDQAETLVVDQVEVKSSDRFVFIGRLEGRPDSHVILAAADGAMVGTLSIRGEAPVQVEYLGGGLHRVNEIEPLPASWCGTSSTSAVEAGTKGNLAGSGPGTLAAESVALSQPLVGNGSNTPSAAIDLLLVYTPKALASAGGEAGIRALMDFAVAEANFCYANSQINVRWNIAYEGMVNYTESGNVCSDSSWLQSNLSALRSTYRADLALMICDLDIRGFSGCAGGWGAAFVRSRVTAGIYLVVHEVSHLLGAGHDRLTCQNQPGNCGAVFSYAYGHRFLADGLTYITVMSYEPGMKIPYFSNPDVLFRGVPTGVPTTQNNSANNALAINSRATNVANYMLANCRFEFAATRDVVPESAGSLTVDVVRTGATNEGATVECVAASGTATADLDFSFSPALLTFARGEVRQSVAVTLLNDVLPEGDETFILSLRNPQAGTALGLNSSTTVVIQDDEVTFHFKADTLLVPEGAGRIEVPVRRNGGATNAASVAYGITDGTAQSGADFQVQTCVLDFAPGETNMTIPIEILDDSLVEADETFTLTLQQASVGAVGVPGAMTVTIADDERPGSLDGGFNVSSGPNDWVYGLNVAADGGVLGAGRFTQVNGQPRTALVRFLPDGSVDSALQPVELLLSLAPDTHLYPAHAAGALPQSDGRILVWGEFGSVNGQRQTHLTRLNPDGTPDTSFVLSPGPNGATYYGTGFSAHGLALQPDGKILIGGGFTSVNGVSRYLLARLLPDGSVDSSFNARPNTDSVYVTAVAVQADGRVLVGGNFTGFETAAKPYLVRLSSDGKLDSTFRGTADGVPLKIHVQADGRILLGGFFNSPVPSLARLNPDGSTDRSFLPQPTLNGHVYDFTVLPDGRIMIAGAFTSVGATRRNGVARLNPDGSWDSTFDTGLGANDIVRAVAVEPAGGVVIGGLFTAVNGEPRHYLARLRSDGAWPVFAPPILLANGDLQLRLFGSAQHRYVVDASDDLATWTPLRTNVLSGTSWMWTESEVKATGRRFYRARQADP